MKKQYRVIRRYHDGTVTPVSPWLDDQTDAGDFLRLERATDTKYTPRDFDYEIEEREPAQINWATL
jgi:hypothetical protein